MRFFLLRNDAVCTQRSIVIFSRCLVEVVEVKGAYREATWKAMVWVSQSLMSLCQILDFPGSSVICIRTGTGSSFDPETKMRYCLEIASPEPGTSLG